MKQIICLLVYLFIFSFSAHASVVLNEVAIQPNQVVELYNTASESADISSWYIDDAGGTTYFTIPPQTILPPLSCTFFSSDFNFNKSSADSVRLFDNTSPPTSSSAKLIEQYPYTKAPDINYSFSKKIEGGTEWQIASSSLGQLNNSLSPCVPTPTATPIPTETPTPTSTPSPSPKIEPTLTPSSTPFPTYENIYISEVYPYPQTGEHEWVELFNENNFQVTLDHWYIDDGENTGSAPKPFSLSIEANSYGSIDFSSSLFNNSGDVVRLLDRDKNEKDTMEYGKATMGKSIGRISYNEDAYCEQEPSKDKINSSCIMEVQKPTPIPKKIASTQSSTIKTQSAQPIINLMQQKNNRFINSTPTPAPPQNEEVLGIQVQNETQPSSSLYLSFVSFSYSLLTIVSVFIKMKYA